jgi:hypothetical protein
MSDKQQTPTLHFFRATPDNLISHPPLCSSLQNLESCFFLLALERYPHALIACASAIESGIKAALKIRPEVWVDLKDLLAQVRSHSHRLQQFSQWNLDNPRRTRNRMVHYGFSPQDDEQTAVLLRKVGFRFLNQCYEEFFDFSLEKGLRPDFFQQLSIATEVYDKAKNIRGLSFTYCFRAFSHLLRWSVKDSLMSHWEPESAQSADETGLKFALCEKQRGKLEQLFIQCWFFDCPICNDVETFACELDDDQLDIGKVHLQRAVCVSCGLVIPHGCPFLTDAICREQIEEKSPVILRAFI